MNYGKPHGTALACGVLVYGLGQIASTAVAARPAPSASISALRITQARVDLNGPYASARLLVDAVTPGGAHDVSGVAALSTANPKVAVVEPDGVLTARGDGDTVVTARFSGRSAQVPVHVHGVAHAGPPRFIADVIPVLTRAGCNAGSCHGAGAGKGGFKLSLYGYDPELDYLSITRSAVARRIVRAQPDNSLLLRKPTMGVAHRGGLRFEVGSEDYRLLRAWIVGGVPGPDPKSPRVVGLDVTPATRTLAIGQTQRFRVQARFSDGTRRDVTDQTLFSPSDETVATVTPEGEAKVVGPGEGAVVIRYQGQVSIARVVSPFSQSASGRSGASGGGTLRTAVSLSHAPEPASSPLDRCVDRKLAALGLRPSPPCSDSDFLRRATLDVLGILPTPEEARAFLADRSPDKRAKLVDSLLARPEYVDFWTLTWADLLRDSRQALPPKAMVAFNRWIRQSVAENRPWDQFARTLLLAQGSAYADGAVNYYRAVTSPQDLSEATTQVFLGVRLQCAKCHNHPYDRWTQNQYYQMSAFFARVAAKKGERPEEQVVYVADRGEVSHPKTRKEVAPCALDSTPLARDFSGDRRAALANWLTSPRNPFFARCLVNRIWKHFMGRGLVEPVDDLRLTNPPTNSELFDWLAADFVRHGYDIKALMRTILLSQTYQRSPDPAPGSERDTRYGSHFAFKRLGAEQLLDAVSAATGVPEKFDGYPQGLRAVQLPDSTVPSYFLDLFGRPARTTSCECERSDAPNLGQVLHLMNDASINGKLSAKGGRVATLLAARVPDRKLVEELYLATFSRFPTVAEGQKAVHALAVSRNRAQTSEDLLWVLLNSKEFVFNH